MQHRRNASNEILLLHLKTGQRNRRPRLHPSARFRLRRSKSVVRLKRSGQFRHRQQDAWHPLRRPSPPLRLRRSKNAGHLSRSEGLHPMRQDAWLRLQALHLKHSNAALRALGNPSELHPSDRATRSILIGKVQNSSNRMGKRIDKPYSSFPKLLRQDLAEADAGFV